MAASTILRRNIALFMYVLFYCVKKFDIRVPRVPRFALLFPPRDDDH